jgi:hypothetical protein
LILILFIFIRIQKRISRRYRLKIGTQMTQIRMINSDFIYKSKKICRISVICVSLYDRIGTQMTQIRLIYTDFIYKFKKICRISVIFLSLYDKIGTQMTQIRLINIDFIYKSKKICRISVICVLLYLSPFSFAPQLRFPYPIPFLLQKLKHYLSNDDNEAKRNHI